MELAQLFNPAIGERGENLNPASGAAAVARFASIIQTVISVLLIVAAIVFVFWFIFGGIKWITSAGDKQQIESARNSILHAVIGLGVVFSLWIILQILGAVFGIDLLQFDVDKLRIQ